MSNAVEIPPTDSPFQVLYCIANFFLLAFTNHITPAMRSIAKWKFLVLGLLDALNAALVIFGGTYTAGSLQVLLAQAVIPWSMILTILFMGMRAI